MSDSLEYRPAPHRRVSLVLGLLGSGCLLWLFFSSPDLTMRSAEGGSARVTVSCEPLGSLSREALDPDDPLTSEQENVVSGYVEKVDQDDPRTGQQRRIDVGDEIETAIVTNCQAVRLDRAVLMGITALPTGLLLLIAAFGARRWGSSDPDFSPLANSTAASD